MATARKQSSPQVSKLEEKIDLLTETVGNLERGFSQLVVKILGGEGEENERARLPMLERNMDDHGIRITRLENITLRYGTAGVVIWAVVQLAISVWKK